MPTKTQVENAVGSFQAGCNCAQAVLVTFCEKYGLEKQLGLQLAGGMGSGFRAGEICGAVSGAVLVIGLKYGQHVESDKETKALCNAKTVAFVERFKNQQGACVCRELLGCDPSTPEGRVKATPLFATTCVGLIASSVKLLEELGY